MRVKTISVTVARTVQVSQFQPSTVSVTETAEVSDKDDVLKCEIKLYKNATSAVAKFMNQEIKKYSKG